MDFSDVKEKLKRNNALLFDWKSSCLTELIGRIRDGNRRTAVIWSFEGVKPIIARLNDIFCGDSRFEEMFSLCLAWAEGTAKMPEAKRAILRVHAAAKETSDPIVATLCHAAAQGCSAVHVKEHAAGLAFYELTAIVREYGAVEEDALREKIEGYLRLFERAAEEEKTPRSWAKFLR